MAIRVTEAEVKQIVPTTLTDEQVTPYLCSANRLIEGVLVGLGYEESELALIELWLAAHLVSVRDPAVASETIGAVSATYHGKSGMGLEHTPYGQQVLFFEYKGTFKALADGRRSAEMKIIG